MIEPVYTILIEGTKENNIQKFKKILEDTIKNINIDIDLIKSYIAKKEFYYKEKNFDDEPKGLFYNINLLKYMLYGKYDFESIKFDKIINSLENIDFKSLLIENTINNNNAVYCILKPTDKEINKNSKKYIKNIKKLEEYQKEIDTIENIQKIPPLAINDIEKDVLKINTNILKAKNRDLIYNNINSDILYFNMIVDISNFSYEYGKYISIYLYLLKKLPTKNYTSQDHPFNGWLALTL